LRSVSDNSHDLIFFYPQTFKRGLKQNLNKNHLKLSIYRFALELADIETKTLKIWKYKNVL
jgi:hypothetical protein